MGKVRRCLVAMWTACAALGAGGATYYVVDLSGGPSADYYPLEILDGEPDGGWTDAHKTTKLVLRQIEPGTFMMCNQVQVTLTRQFFIGVFEVTQKQYELVMGRNPSDSQGDKLPVETVSWDAIRGSDDWPNSSVVGVDSFIGRLRARSRLDTFDLPTEAQWEYACRAGTTTDFNNGTSMVGDFYDEDENLNQLGWYVWNALSGPADVGELTQNAWGLYDMHGNVREWCLDHYAETLNGGNDPRGPETGARVMRGGGWEDYTGDCKSSSRKYAQAGSGTPYVGFRVVCRPVELVQSVAPYEGTYDGEGHGIDVDVSLPPTATVKYALSAAGPYQEAPILFTNVTAGAVTVWYKVEAVGYGTVTSNSTVTISKATYDFSSVGWDYPGPFEGDGAAKTVVLTNLPVGVTAAYTGNTATEPGTYTAHAAFTYDATNYEPPVVADLEWSINAPVVLDVEDIIGYPTTVGSNGVGTVEGIVDTTVGGWRSVWFTAADSSEAWVELSVTNALSVSFDWRCSCEALPKKGEPYDYMMFSVDGNRLAYIGGETDWTNVIFRLSGEGVQTLRWTYFKDDSDFEGDDCSWLANVAIEYPRKMFLIRIQ